MCANSVCAAARWCLCCSILLLAAPHSLAGTQKTEGKRGADISLAFPYEYDLSCLAISPNVKMAAGGCPAGRPYVRVWDLRNGHQLRHFKVAHHVVSVGFTPDSKRVFGLSMGGVDHIEMWDIESGKCVSKFRIPYCFRHYGCRATLSPDATTIVAGGQMSFASSRRMNMREFMKASQAGKPKEFLFHAWDIKTGKKLRSFKGHAGAAYCQSFSPDGRLIVSGSGDRTIRLWESATGNELHCFTPRTPVPYSQGLPVLAASSLLRRKVADMPGSMYSKRKGAHDPLRPDRVIGRGVPSHISRLPSR